MTTETYVCPFVQRKNELIKRIDSGCLYNSFSALSGLKIHWCSNGYGYKGVELCDRILNIILSDKVNNYTNLHKAILELRNSYRELNIEHIYG